jgi:hypothetical protein
MTQRSARSGQAEQSAGQPHRVGRNSAGQRFGHAQRLRLVESEGARSAVRYAGAIAREGRPWCSGRVILLAVRARSSWARCGAGAWVIAAPNLMSGAAIGVGDLTATAFALCAYCGRDLR